MKPALLTDADEGKLRFPCIAQPKVDGVRGLNLEGNLTARSLKPFKNRHVTTLFSRVALVGLDGEFAAQSETHPDLCRLTSSALGTIQGEPFVLWWLFDLVTPETVELPYSDRLQLLRERYFDLQRSRPELALHLRLMPTVICKTKEELLDWDTTWLAAGYEGTVVCNPRAAHKSGRWTVREGGKLRIKRFVDFEFTVTDIIEGEENTNTATLNELGLTERSSHQAGMVANGMIGAMIGKVTSVVKDGDKVLFAPGEIVRVGAGCLSHEQRRYYFKHQVEFMQQIHKAKFFPKGIKDKPRFPTWQSFRAPEDM